MRAAIDYGEHASVIGIVERIDIDNAILGGERSAKQIADDLGTTERTVVRRRAELRRRGFRLRVPEPECDETHKEALRRGLDSIRHLRWRRS